MQTSIRKIGAILSIIVLLPLIIYTIYELNSLSENEQVLEKIYSEQLNTIIFSVNQYLDDVVQDWAGKAAEIYLRENSEQSKKQLAEFCTVNSAVSLIVVTDSSISENIQFYSDKWFSSSQDAIKRMQKILKSNYKIIEDLKRFKSLGYNKVASLDNALDDTPLLSFLMDTGKGELKIVTFVINMDEFVNSIITKKLNSISDEDLVVSIYHNEDLISRTGPQEILFDDLLEYERLWNFPNYYLGISTPGPSIKDIVQDRSTINIIMLGLLNLIILIGAWFVFRNIKKEIKLSQLKSDFVSNVSHEIRTPLSLIGMFAETLELHRVKTEEKKDEYYKIIRKETERLTRIVNSILNLSKMESKGKKFNFETVDLNNIVDEVVDRYQHQLNDGGNNCLISKSDNLSPLKLDKEAVMEAIINLIDNAVKYCENKAQIEISTGITEHFVYVEVSDNGLGISKENQKKIFEKFYRVASGNVHNSKGSGLGLSLVQHIMEAHKGNVTVESKIGKGSHFRLNFPLDNKK